MKDRLFFNGLGDEMQGLNVEELHRLLLMGGDEGDPRRIVIEITAQEFADADAVDGAEFNIEKDQVEKGALFQLFKKEPAGIVDRVFHGCLPRCDVILDHRGDLLAADHFVVADGDGEHIRHGILSPSKKQREKPNPQRKKGGK